MNHDITLTIDEIHAIREEYSTHTKNLSNDEYHRYLEDEATPIWLALERTKAEYKSQF